MIAEGRHHLIAMSSDPETYVFDRVNQHPRVCSNCFRLRQHETPVPERIARLSKRTMWADAVTPERTRTQYVSVDAPPGEAVSDRTERTVCDCGEFSAFGQVRRSHDDPLDKPTAISYTGHLSRTLDTLSVEAWERGNLLDAARFDHDRDVLYDCVRDLKSRPEYQFRDDHIFAASVEVACDHGATHDEIAERGPVRNGDSKPNDRSRISADD